jgi:TolA-binding protein
VEGMKMSGEGKTGSPVTKGRVEELKKAKEEMSTQVAKKDEKILSLKKKIEDINESKEEEIQQLQLRLEQCKLFLLNPK